MIEERRIPSTVVPLAGHALGGLLILASLGAVWNGERVAAVFFLAGGVIAAPLARQQLARLSGVSVRRRTVVAVVLTAILFGVAIYTGKWVPEQEQTGPITVLLAGWYTVAVL